MSTQPPSIVVFRVAAIALLISAASFGDSPSTRPASADRFHYAGDVIDERGVPIANVTVTVTARQRDSDGYAYIDQVTTDATGRFEIDRAVAMSGLPRAGLDANAILWLECNDAGHLFARREDLATLTADACDALNVSMKDGRAQAGSVVDQVGKPVADALVRVTFEKDWLAGKGVITDAAGRFAIRGVPTTPGTISVVVARPDGSLQACATPLTAQGPGDAITLAVAPVQIASADVRDVLGMKLAPLDPSTADALGRHAQSGLLVLDPGKDVARFQIGDLKAGDVFWYVGEKEVNTVDAFRRQLLNAKQPHPGGTTCRVVYRLRRADFDGTNTQSMSLSDADLATLQRGDMTPAR